MQKTYMCCDKFNQSTLVYCGMIYVYGHRVLRVRQQIRGKIIILNFTQFIHGDDIHPRHVQQVVVIHVYIIIIIILHINDPWSRDLLCTLHTFIHYSHHDRRKIVFPR